MKDLTDINAKRKVLFQDSHGEKNTKVIQQLSFLPISHKSVLAAILQYSYYIWEQSQNVRDRSLFIPQGGVGHSLSYKKILQYPLFAALKNIEPPLVKYLKLYTLLLSQNSVYCKSQNDCFPCLHDLLHYYYIKDSFKIPISVLILFQKLINNS